MTSIMTYISMQHEEIKFHITEILTLCVISSTTTTTTTTFYRKKMIAKLTP